MSTPGSPPALHLHRLTCCIFVPALVVHRSVSYNRKRMLRPEPVSHISPITWKPKSKLFVDTNSRNPTSTKSRHSSDHMVGCCLLEGPVCLFGVVSL